MSVAETKRRKTVDPTTQMVRTPRVKAGACPTSETHQNTRIYSTNGQIRYCVCDDCGKHWKQTGEYADPLKAYCTQLADSLEQAERRTEGADEVIVMDDGTAKQIVADLRRYVSS